MKIKNHELVIFSFNVGNILDVINGKWGSKIVLNCHLRYVSLRNDGFQSSFQIL